MNYKITTDFSKVKKEKCECVDFSGAVKLDCKLCSGTGNKPIKITYKAGEKDSDFKIGEEVYHGVYPEKKNIVILERIKDEIAYCRERLGFGRKIKLIQLRGKLHPKIN